MFIQLVIASLFPESFIIFPEQKEMISRNIYTCTNSVKMNVN